MAKRLFLIRTPLQALIVQAIRERTPGRDTIIYHPTSGSPKHRTYFDKIGDAQKIFVPPSRLRSHTLGELSCYWGIPRAVKQATFDECHLASIGNIPFALLIRHQPHCALGVFDDGTFNLDAAFLDGWINREPLSSKAIKRIFGAPNNADLVKRFAVYHTIFERDKLVITADKIVPLKLFQEGTGGTRPITVVLGTPAHLFSEAAQKEYKRLLDVLDYDLFLPHPAEHNTPFIGPVLAGDEALQPDIHTHIAEDIIRGLCARGFAPRIYGFGSTTLTNVSQHLQTTNIVISGMNSARADVLEGLGVPACASHDFV